MAKSTGSWMRRVVPPGYTETRLQLLGTSPLLMNSGEVDRDTELFRAFFLLGQKKRKSLEDEARLRELEWELRLYMDADIGPYVPGKNVKELLRSAATKWRRGEDIKRSLVVVPYRIPLTYEGPRDQASLWEAGYRYTTMVANAGIGSGRVLRCRPMFEKWSLDVEIAYDPDELDHDFLAIVAERAQKYGLGDFRPEFGSFLATLSGPSKTRGSRSALGTKTRDLIAEAAHETFVESIVVASANGE